MAESLNNHEANPLHHLKAAGCYSRPCTVPLPGGDQLDFYSKIELEPFQRFLSWFNLSYHWLDAAIFQAVTSASISPPLL